MKKYMILANPGHSRIYFDTALKISISEIQAISNSKAMGISEIQNDSIGKVPAISFISEKELDEDDFKALGSASIYYAMFEQLEGGLLKPIDVPDFHVFPESMVQILKYNGKTNEQFTRLMMNLGVSACKTRSEKLTILDPMCGKGTTLYEGFIRGYDVKGIEINDQWTQEISTYIVRYLKEGRFKHKVEKSKASFNGKKIAGINTITASEEKSKFIKGDVQSFQIFNGDTRKADLFIKNKSCDIIVSDLPYGVQHGSKSMDTVKMSRSPLALLKESLPSWYKTLKVKGSIVLSYNEFTMKYDEASQALEKAGFKVLNEYPYNDYIHRVDQSINRNIIVAVKL